MLDEFLIRDERKERSYSFSEVKESDEAASQLRVQIVERLLSENGLSINFKHIQKRDISNILTFRISGKYLTVEDELGVFAAINFSDHDDKMLKIEDKYYVSGKPIYSGKGVMQMAFSLLCEYARSKGYTAITGRVARNLGNRGDLNMTAVHSRKNAIDLTSRDLSSTYNSVTQFDEETRELVTRL